MVIVYCQVVYSQDLSSITEQPPLTVSGTLSTNQSLRYNSVNPDNNNVYNDYYTGNLNTLLYGVSIPISFRYTSGETNLSHPFNQLSLQPSYEWVRGHIGYSSMSFSPYTLSGHRFNGVGIEVTPPGGFRASAMYGRLQKAVEADTTRLQQTPSYKRMGYGLKAGYQSDGDFIDVSYFGAKDQINTISDIPFDYDISPKENSVMSVSFRKNIFDNLAFTGEYASNYLTTDQQTGEKNVKNAFFKPQTWFMPVRSSTINRNALKAGLAYTKPRYSIGAGYERIDPEYKTLGAYYFNNNMENVTLNFSTNFFENKISFSGNTGLQRDNLDNNNMNNHNRFVGSGNLNLAASEKLNLNFSYSNFISYTNVRSTFDYINDTQLYEDWDTLNYRQISQNMNINTSYRLGHNEERSQAVSANITYQVSQDQEGNNDKSTSNFYNANVSYNLNIIPHDLNISTSLNFNRNEVTESRSNTWGPGVNVSKQFLEKTLRTSLSAAFNKSENRDADPSYTYNFRLNTVYNIKNNHNINANFLLQLRDTGVQTNNNHTITLGYVYNFSIIEPE